MKKRFLPIALAALLIGGTFTQCEKKLDLSPLGTLDEQTFYQSENDFKGALLLAYSALLNYTYEQFDGGGWFKGVLLTDDDTTYPNGSVDNVDLFNWTSTDGTWRALWQTTYKGIQRSNIVLEKLPEAKGLPDATRKAFDGEARFLRAYYNFFLATQFGQAPLVEKTARSLEETRSGNSTAGQLWDVVVSDLKLAKEALPEKWDDGNRGRATKGAATALLGKVLLYRAQWENKPALYTEAASEFQSLIGKYSLVKNFQDNFTPTTENNAESIFEIQMGLGGGNPWLPADFNFSAGGSSIGDAGTARLIYFRASCGPNNICAPGSNAQGYGQVQITTPLQNEFEKGDPRRAATIFLEGDPYDTGENVDGSKKWVYQAAYSGTGSSPAKYVKKDGNIDFRSNLSVNNERVIRYADVLLMLAECKILGPTKDLAGAAQLINQVRRRADPTGAILPDVTATTEADLFKALMHERRVEFALESHRYNDLVRWHRAGKINIKQNVDFGRQAANANWSDKNLLKPIPQSELDLNPELKQNTGY
ncbi:RagB/SusD family nutrient uptake outer membrane protein [Nibrella saemangeumensis]|uniref:RagB/SusD family nutrient uptake outer membrane protein n=1 Tax=Nibrella saemangeumensis TaxID=1084526 RepID=A0ABP8NDE8_9BACT